MSTFHLPDLGEGLQEAEIVAWHVSAGDHVTADQPLVSVETDKAVVEVPSPRAGHIEALHAAPGDIVAVGAPLVAFRDDGAADRGTVVGEIAAEAVPPPEAPPQHTNVRASPAVRKHAAELGVNLETVEATGHDGEVTMTDVNHAATAETAAGAVEPVRGARRAMAARMADAHGRVAPATVVDDADIDTWPANTDVTLRLIRAVVAGCLAEPALNAWYNDDANIRRLCATVDVGVAVDTADGLFVPVLRDAAGRDEADLAAALGRLKADVRGRTVPPAALRGQTITLSNFGALGGRYGALAIVPPQVAILGAGRRAPRVVAADGGPAVHDVLPLSLTFDHRVVTGGEAARFLAAVIADLEHAE
jgi:pyruvate dehydrogenase E2 component (dihydrolipoamide acetyltransferase)